MWISGETAITPGRPRARVAVVVGIAERTMSPSEARDSNSATSSRAAPENVVSSPRTKAAGAHQQRRDERARRDRERRSQRTAPEIAHGVVEGEMPHQDRRLLTMGRRAERTAGARPATAPDDRGHDEPAGGEVRGRGEGHRDALGPDREGVKWSSA